jgi:hypothetical protein
MVLQLGQGIFGRPNDFASHYHTEDFDGRFQGLRRWNGGRDEDRYRGAWLTSRAQAIAVLGPGAVAH